jgi:photosystem II stability/assembly factor-like uncharacterized protein
MSFSKSNLTSGDFLTNLSGIEGIASTYDLENLIGKLYYSIDAGANWILSKCVPNTSFVTALSLKGAQGCLNAIAAGINNDTYYPTIYYSTDSGKTWNISESGLPGLSTTEIYKMLINICGLNGVIAIETGIDEVYLYYSIDGGNNWDQSFYYNSFLEEYTIFYFQNAAINNSAITLYKNVDMSNVIYIITFTDLEFDTFNIYTSIDGGKNLNLTYVIPYFKTFPTGLSLSGPISLLGGYISQEENSQDSPPSYGYLYKSLDGGLTWSITLIVYENNFYFTSVSLDVIYGNDLIPNISNSIINKITALAAALDTENSICKIYNSLNLDSTWRKSTEIDKVTPIDGSFNSVFLYGTSGIAGSNSNKGLYYSTDTGQTWVQSNIQYGIYLSVYLYGLNGIAGTGDDDGIWVTMDSGKNWQKSIINDILSPTNNSFSSVYLFKFDGIAGSISDNGIYYTSNNGLVWDRSFLKITTRNIFSINLSGTNGVAGSASNDGIYYTNDGGQTFNLSNIYYDIFLSVYLSEINSTNGIAGSGSNKGIFYTIDGGETWTESNIITGNFISVVLFGTNGIAGSGSNKGIFYTNDYGQNWTQSTLLDGVTLLTGFFYSVSLYGTNGIAGSINDEGIFYSINSGQTWTVSNIITGNFISVVLSGTNGIASGFPDDGIFYTIDSGQTWSQSTLLDGVTTISGFFASVYLIGINGIAGGGSDQGIFYTSNSGQNWAQSNITSGDFYSVYIGGYGIAGSASNLGLYYSNDAGQTWYQSNITTGNFYSVYLNGLNGVAGSYSGDGFFYTTDGGQNWDKSTVYEPIFYTNGSFNSVILSGKNGIAGGASDNGILYTDDKGKNWSYGTLPDRNTKLVGNFLSVYLSGNNGIAGSGSDDGIYYTVDGGITWSQSTLTDEVTILTDSFYSVVLSENNGIAASVYGGIYYTVDKGKTWSLSTFYDKYTSINITFYSLTLIGLYGVAGSAYDDQGIWYTTDAGKSWIQTNIIFGSFKSVFLSGKNAIAGSESDNGIYYTTNITGDIWDNQILPVINVTDVIQIKISDSIGFIALKTPSLNLVYKTANSGKDWKISAKFSNLNINDISLSNIAAILGTDAGIYYYILASPPQQYANQETIDLADDLLPTILEGYTKDEVIEILNNPDNQNLVDLLRQFCNQTYKAQIYRNNGQNYCCYQVKWENVGNIKNIDPRNMWNLNYLLFTVPNSGDLSMFIFAVLYVVKWNLKGYLRQTLNSQGLSYC